MLPRDTISEIIDASLTHLTMADVATLEELPPGIACWKGTYGFIVMVNQDNINAMEDAHINVGALRLMAQCLRDGIGNINFDRDAEHIPGFEIYKHD